MSKKRSSRAHSSGRRTAGRSQSAVAGIPRWRQILLLASVVPMLAGLVLFVASWFDAVWIGTATTQTVTGALLALGGFALSNALQSKWTLAWGWVLLALAVWLLLNPPLPWLFWAGAVLGIAGLVLVFLAFSVRYRQVRATSR